MDTQIKNLAVFAIERWDSIIPDISGGPMSPNPMPVVYIKPTQDFIDYAEKNNYIIQVTVKNTNSIYDGNVMNATVDSSKYVPNFKPVFYGENGWYTLMLHSYFYEYPPKNGELYVFGLNKPVSNALSNIMTNIPPLVKNNNLVKFIAILLILLIVIIVLVKLTKWI